MPAAGPILTIVAPRCIDAAQYASAAGVVDSAFLGTRIAQNDRWLHANARRDLAQPFPVPAPPTTGFVHGHRIAEFCPILTPQLQRIEWYVRADVPAGAKLWAYGYVVGDNVRQPWQGLDPGDTAVVAILGGAGGEQNIGPISVDVRGLTGPHEVGLCIWAENTAVAIKTGAVTAWGPGHVTGAVGEYAPWAGLLPPHIAICLTDGVGGAQLTPWYDVVSIGQRAAANDTAYLWPPRLGEEWIGQPTPGNQYGYAVTEVAHMDLLGILHHEVPLTGTLATVA